MRKSIVAAALVTLALASTSGTALAHTKLLSSTPAAKATVTSAKAKSITLVFNERLIASTIKAELVMTRKPGAANQSSTKIAFASSMGRDGKSLTLVPRRALSPGTYKVSWSAAGADTHRMGSEFSFTVR